MGSKGGQGLAGWALKTEQKGYFKGTGLGTGAGVGLRPQVSPGPLLVLTWLFQGARGGLGLNLLGEKNFKIKKRKEKKTNPQINSLFLFFPNPNQKVCYLLLKNHISEAAPLSDSISQDF